MVGRIAGAGGLAISTRAHGTTPGSDLADLAGAGERASGSRATANDGYDFDRLERAVLALAERYERARSGSARLEQELAERDRRIAELESQIRELNQSRRDIAKRIDDLIGQLDHLEGQLGPRST